MKKYEDIIGLSRPVSKKHPPMSRENRAAQFAPFAALTGFEGAIKETARVTGEKIELDETQKTFLDEKLKVLLREKTPALFTYFQKDEQKEGGAYITVSGIVKKTDAYTHKIVLEDGTGSAWKISWRYGNFSDPAYTSASWWWYISSMYARISGATPFASFLTIGSRI